MTLKQLFAICLIAFIAVLPVFVFSPFASAQSGTTQRGIITSDTVWTKTGSPYNLAGPVAVQQGVTLTVEPGVTINLNAYYIQVNGTFSAVGSQSDKIYINGGSAINFQNTFTASGPAGITFYPTSPNLNESTPSSSLVENVVFNGTQVEVEDDTKIRSSLGFGLIISGNALVTDNSQCSITVLSGNPVISNNNIVGGISVYGGSPRIINNQIQGGSWGIALGVKHPLDQADAPYVSGNTITGSFYQGIIATGTATVEHNLIVGQPNANPPPTGISIDGGEVTAQYNTIVNCATAIYIQASGNIVITHNNIENTTRYYVYNSSPSTINAPSNWWGTTNQSAIDAAIYDNKNDFNLGIVNIQPILTAPEQNAPAAPTPTTAPTQTPTTSPTTNPSPTIPEFTTTATIIILAIAASTALLARRKQVIMK